eukprot:TRINITY_DN4647_c0_g4_i1.p1 TRINITY_DN4647_c0_g4~~TRINITY_DN4647_c0_g4_i1.p1  ORF type:complete len:295 (-),score=54.75 TRINITY_DN4647_c0_g4_i1:172-996(-)
MKQRTNRSGKEKRGSSSSGCGVLIFFAASSILLSIALFALQTQSSAIVTSSDEPDVLPPRGFACAVAFTNMVFGANQPVFDAYLINATGHIFALASREEFDSQSPYTRVPMANETEKYILRVVKTDDDVSYNTTVLEKFITLNSAFETSLVFIGTADTTDEYPFDVITLEKPMPKNRKIHGSLGCINVSPGSPPLFCNLTSALTGQVLSSWVLPYGSYAWNTTFSEVYYQVLVSYASNDTLILNYATDEAADTIQLWYLCGSLYTYPGFGLSEL